MASDPARMLEQLSEKIKELFVLAPSKKLKWTPESRQFLT
jgi:hypothetical protein